MVRFGAIQMDAAPAPAEARLARASALVAQAAQAGAQVIVLPELFNAGYEYSDANYRRAEPPEGPTVTALRELAARWGVYLAGSLLLLDTEDIYNAMVLVGPEGRLWRYDKVYPWAWERAYFRAGERVTVAETPLGRFGMLICWDVAHPGLWARYASKVDAMLVCSCPPRTHDMTLVFPDGQRLAVSDVIPLHRRIRRTSGDLFGPLLRRQATALGVPVVNTTGTGLFSSPVPLPKLSLTVYTLGHPLVRRFLDRAEDVRVEAGYFNETYVADAQGRVLAQVPAGAEHVAVADVPLAEAKPRRRQPRFGLLPAPYALDGLANALLAPAYRRAVRHVHGPHMAPFTPRDRRRRAALAAALALGVLLGRRRSGRSRD